MDAISQPYSHAPPVAGRIKCLWVRLFGTKICDKSGRYGITAYAYKGRIYILEVLPEGE